MCQLICEHQVLEEGNGGGGANSHQFWRHRHVNQYQRLVFVSLESILRYILESLALGHTLPEITAGG